MILEPGDICYHFEKGELITNFKWLVVEQIPHTPNFYARRIDADDLLSKNVVYFLQDELKLVFEVEFERALVRHRCGG